MLKRSRGMWIIVLVGALCFFQLAGNAAAGEAEDAPVSEEEAIVVVKKLAEQGDPDAQTRLGFFYFSGTGVEQNAEQAAHWTRKAAEQGRPVAQNNLGDFYLNGTGVEQDFVQAAQWFEKSTDQGFVPAQLELGKLYYFGEGVQQNYERAFELINAVAKQKEYQKAKLAAHVFLFSWIIFDNSHTSDWGDYDYDYSDGITMFRDAVEQGSTDVKNFLQSLLFKLVEVEPDYDSYLYDIRSTLFRLGFVDLNAVSDKGKTLLSLAIELNDVPAVSALVKGGVNISEADVAAARNNRREGDYGSYRMLDDLSLGFDIQESRKRSEAQKREREEEKARQAAERERLAELERQEEEQRQRRRYGDLVPVLSTLPAFSEDMIDGFLERALGETSDITVGCGFDNVEFGMSPKEVEDALGGGELTGRSSSPDSLGIRWYTRAYGESLFFRNDKLIAIVKRLPYNAFDYKDYRELFDDPDGDPRFEITVAQSSEFGWGVSRLNTSMYAFADSVCMLQQGDQDGSNEPGGEFMTRFFFDKTALTDLLKEYIRGVYPLLRRFSAEALTTPRERNIPWSASVYQGGEKLTYSFINLGGRLQASPMDDNINTLQEYNGQYGLYIMLLNAYMLDAINPNVRKGYNTDGRLGLNATDGIIEESRPFFAVEFGDSGHYAEVLLDGTVYPKRK